MLSTISAQRRCKFQIQIVESVVVNVEIADAFISTARIGKLPIVQTDVIEIFRKFLIIIISGTVQPAFMKEIEIAEIIGGIQGIGAVAEKTSGEIITQRTVMPVEHVKVTQAAFRATQELDAARIEIGAARNDKDVNGIRHNR